MMTHLTVHLFSSSKVRDFWIHQNHRMLISEGWKGLSVSLYRHPDEREIRLIVASNRRSSDELRGITIHEVEVHGPWTDNLIELHDAALMCVRPKETK